MADLSEITAILKARYETGAFGNAHFLTPQSIYDAVRDASPPATPRFGVGASLDSLLGIPVVVDEELPPDTWRLIDTLSGEVLHEGRVET